VGGCSGSPPEYAELILKGEPLFERTEMLKVAEVEIAKGGRPILTKVNLEAEARQIIALLGPSGCGKTSLVRVLAGLEQPRSGTAEICGSAAAELLERGEIGYVQQNPILLPWFDARKNAGLLKYCRDGIVGRRLTSLAGLVDLGEEVLDQTSRTLSGGQMQRVALIRALVLDPTLLLLDESFASIDTPRKVELLPELRQNLVNGTSRTVATVIVSHDMADCLLFADQIYYYVGITPSLGTFVKVHEVKLPGDRQNMGLEDDVFIDELRELNTKMRSLSDGQHL
jgi:ABC-type nitrate/sulfonate/bicarbonate transport system ATPase subunit